MQGAEPSEWSGVNSAVLPAGKLISIYQTSGKNDCPAAERPRDESGSDPNTATSRPFYRGLQANWRIEYIGSRFIIRRDESANVKNILPI